MAAKKQSLSNALLNAVLRGETYTGPTTVYAGLVTSIPTATTAGTEVTGGGYVRVAVTFSEATAGTSSNTGPVVFPAATAPWGNVAGVALYDAETNGDQLYYGNLGTAKTVGIGDQLTFATAALAVSES